MDNKCGMANLRFVWLLLAAVVATGTFALVKLDPTGKSGNRMSSDYSYDISDLLKIDPELIGWEEMPPAFETGFVSAKAIAAGAGGVVYVVGDSELRAFDDGQVLFAIELQGKGTCVAVDGETIYVGASDHVESYGRDGKRGGSWKGLGERAVLTSIAVGKDSVFVADAGNRVVYRYDKEGEIVNRIGVKDDSRNIPGFSIPSPYFDLAMGEDGLLRVVNPGMHRIEAYTSDGDLEFFWGDYSNTRIEGFCGCCNPVNFAILADGNFVTCEKGITRVKEYDSEGKFIDVVAGPAELNMVDSSRICSLPSDCQKGGFDVTVDERSMVLVLDAVSNMVRTFTKKK